MKNEAAFKELREHYPGIPALGPTGSAYVEAEVTVETPGQVVERVPPFRPWQTYDVLEDVQVDEDGEEYPVYRTETMTDEEYVTALALYEVELAEWKRTGGRAVIAGAPTMSGRFTCLDGTVCVGVGDGSNWRWTEISTKS